MLLPIADHQRCSASKSMSLHQHSKEELGIGTSHHQILRAQCVAPHRRRPSLQTTVAQHRQRASYARLGLAQMPSRWSATIFCLQIAARLSHSFQNFDFSTFSIFSIFRFWIPRQAIHQHRLIPLISGPQSSLTIVDWKHRS